MTLHGEELALFTQASLHIITSVMQGMDWGEPELTTWWANYE